VHRRAITAYGRQRIVQFLFFHPTTASCHLVVLPLLVTHHPARDPQRDLVGRKLNINARARLFYSNLRKLLPLQYIITFQTSARFLDDLFRQCICLNSYLYRQHRGK